ncbi:MAG TPA: 4-(cytidine 5'-diphospho)-2-C-methyl-D-erythritol kinase [Gemmatimonadales bacterium]|nr:4-(cytidine 5'-diphospho)-2-C-methyl-D-erythritol kinase [Gemmatimonadales bacterium]
MSDTLTLDAPAKLNLFLRILARESDGFHGLETLFCRISLSDRLTVERRPGGISIDVTGGETGPADQNLAVRAARMVVEATGGKFGVHLTLEKRIPVKAGLGGGSSDAAAALLGVNQLAGNPVPKHELLQFAARLGSDVPFFLSGSSLALAWGHGERMLTLPPLPTHPALLLVSGEGVSTPEAYRWVDEDRTPGTRRGAVAMEGESVRNWGNIGRLSGNDFESAVFGRRPELRAAFERLAGTHPLLCRMSGSGSALFAVYRSAAEREDAQMSLGRKLGQLIPVDTA